MCDLEATVAPSIFNVIRSVASLTRMFPTLDLRCEEKTARRGHGQIVQAELLKLQKSGQFPDEPVRIKGTPIYYHLEHIHMLQFLLNSLT